MTDEQFLAELRTKLAAAKIQMDKAAEQMRTADDEFQEAARLYESLKFLVNKKEKERVKL